MAWNDKNVTWDIVVELGVLSESKGGWRLELNMVSWNGKDPKYDLRSWSPDHKKMGKGITFTEEEIQKLKDILKEM